MFDKKMKDYIIIISSLIGIIILSFMFFHQYEYKYVNVNSIKDIQNYSSLTLNKEDNNFLYVRGNDVNGQKVSFIVNKNVDYYKDVMYLLQSNNNLLSNTNLMKISIIFILVVILLIYIKRDKLFKSKKKINKKDDDKKDENSGKFKISYSTTTFNDIAGYEYAKDEVREVLDQLQNPEKYKRLGAKMIKGVILHGPPGTGKTFLAKAIAGEANVPFISVSGSDFVEEYVGRGAGRVRELFETAKKHAPCILFIDEIDALGAKRTGESNNKEYENTVNALLTELQGFNSNEHIVLVGATNRLEYLDDALLRPGRLDRKIEIGLPDKQARTKLISHLMKIDGRKFSDNCDIERLSDLTYNFSAADLESLINESILLAARSNENVVSNNYLLMAFDKVSNGIKSKKQLNELDKRTVAYHEAGHAIITKYFKPNDIIQKISILPQGNSLGYVQKLPKGDIYLQSKDDLIAEVKILLAGRIAEEVFCNQKITTGAEQDFKVATNIISQMIYRLGMFKYLAYIENQVDYELINEKLVEYYKETKHLIENELYEKTKVIAELLIKLEVITGEDISIVDKKIKELKKEA